VGSSGDGATTGHAARVLLRRVSADDEAEFTRLARQSFEFHRQWIQAPTTPEDFREYVGRFSAENAEGHVVCLRSTGAIAGFVNLNEIVLGPYRRGLLGYGAFVPTLRQGYMTEGLGLMVRHAFDDLELHRLEADIQPANTASANLVRKLGFRLEGTSPGFIRINGRWMDHQRWALTNEA
jgi:[ribosomal protein S5]-alanine N-acetyltransferase